MLNSMDTSKYSGRAGLYVKARPKHRLDIPFLTRLGHGPNVVEDLHVTIMCSWLAPVPSALLALWPALSRPLQAEVKCLRWIAGHDRRGYLIAELVSIDAQDRHDLLTKIGCSPRWGEEFFPHMTLMKGINKRQAQAFAQPINNDLVSRPVKFTLSDTVCVDLG